jgi:hypothetical protein
MDEIVRKKHTIFFHELMARGRLHIPFGCGSTASGLVLLIGMVERPSHGTKRVLEKENGKCPDRQVFRPGSPRSETQRSNR